MTGALRHKGTKINLTAEKKEDLLIMATLSQDALIKITNMKWAKKKKRFLILMTRFCWELEDLAISDEKHYQRINSIMSFETVLAVRSKGIDQTKTSIILSLLTIKYHNSKNQIKEIELIFSGGGNLILSVECIDIMLKDVSEPFQSGASNMPTHLDINTND